MNNDDMAATSLPPWWPTPPPIGATVWATREEWQANWIAEQVVERGDYTAEQIAEARENVSRYVEQRIARLEQRIAALTLRLDTLRLYHVRVNTQPAAPTHKDPERRWPGQISGKEWQARYEEDTLLGDTVVWDAFASVAYRAARDERHETERHQRTQLPPPPPSLWEYE